MLFLLLALLALPAFAQEPSNPWFDGEEEPEVVEVSDQGELWRWCYTKSLRNGVQLPDNPALYRRWTPSKAWGTPEMIEVLSSAAEEMAWVMPDVDPVVVGDISTKRGGKLRGHKSHRGGVDADIGLYWHDGVMYMGNFPVLSVRDMDRAATWQLIRAMLDTGHVERILLDDALVRALRRYVIAEKHLSREEAWRVFPSTANGEMWRKTGVVHHSPGHKHHMHVRVFCPILD